MFASFANFANTFKKFTKIIRMYQNISFYHNITIESKLFYKIDTYILKNNQFCYRNSNAKQWNNTSFVAVTYKMIQFHVH